MQRYPVQLEWVINQYFEIDHYQPLLFIVDSFDHLFALVDDARAVDEGRQARQRRARRAARSARPISRASSLRIRDARPRSVTVARRLGRLFSHRPTSYGVARTLQTYCRVLRRLPMSSIKVLGMTVAMAVMTTSAAFAKP